MIHLNPTFPGSGTWRSRKNAYFHTLSSIITRLNHLQVNASITRDLPSKNFAISVHKSSSYLSTFKTKTSIEGELQLKQNASDYCICNNTETHISTRLSTENLIQTKFKSAKKISAIQILWTVIISNAQHWLVYSQEAKFLRKNLKIEERKAIQHNIFIRNLLKSIQCYMNTCASNLQLCQMTINWHSQNLNEWIHWKCRIDITHWPEKLQPNLRRKISLVQTISSRYAYNNVKIQLKFELNHHVFQ